MLGELLSNGYEIDCVSNVEASLEKARVTGYDIAIIDTKLRCVDGLALLKLLKKKTPNISIFFISSNPDRNIRLSSLRLSLDGVENLEVSREFTGTNSRKNRQSASCHATERKAALDVLNMSRDRVLIHRSEVMKEIFARIPEYAAAKAPMLISGEKGTGKDFIISMITTAPNNPRVGKPFIAVNCGAIPEECVESELFGRTGAFGIIPYKKGLLEEADGGTIYFDEISEASPELQDKIMDIIENGEFRRFWRKKMCRADVFIIGASSHDLSADVANGRFNRDLFSRLTGIHVEIPPLRDRREDIVPLAEYFLDSANRKLYKNAFFADEALAVLETFDWPENVRQLKSVVFSAVASATDEKINESDFIALISCNVLK